MSQQAIRTEVTATDKEISDLFGVSATASTTVPCEEGLWKRESNDHWQFYKFTE